MRPEAELDIECFHNWFLIGITDRKNNVEWDFQMVPGTQLPLDDIRTLLAHYTIVTFNGTGYDMPMLLAALAGHDCETLKRINDEIIVSGQKWWTVMRKYNLRKPDWIDHIDVSEVAPGVRVSLKQYMCRMSSKLVQDTPVDFNLPLPLEHAPEEIYYCRNDRRGTGQLRDECDERIQMRYALSERFGVDLRSKSDAQAAEAMVKAEWSRRMWDSITRFNADNTYQMHAPDRYPHQSVMSYDQAYDGKPIPIIPHYAHGTTFKVRLPGYVHFVTPQMKEFLEIVRTCDFFISDKDEAELLGLDAENIKTGVLIPPELKGRDITIGRTTYRVGIGGLHSQESSVSYKSIPGVCTLRTADVASYYPTLIINAGMNPPQLGPLFLTIYKGFYDERLSAKSEVKKHAVDTPTYKALVTARDGFKIVLNGTFGKLFSRYSIFYAPEFGIAVTIGGQLSLLILIERLELSGIRVVSANTDGIEMLIPAGYEWVAKSVVDWWQTTTNLTMEDSDYLALYARDVNNYIRMDADGSVKRKGTYGKSGVLQNKHPDLDICSDAVVAFLSTGKPLQETIVECRDIRKFVRVRGAKGGATWIRDGLDDGIMTHADGGKSLLGGQHLGRAVRWYYAKDSKAYIVDTKSLNKVAGSDGACPVMTLPDHLPTDIDYRYYVMVAEEMLTDIAYGQENR